MQRTRVKTLLLMLQASKLEKREGKTIVDDVHNWLD